MTGKLACKLSLVALCVVSCASTPHSKKEDQSSALSQYRPPAEREWRNDSGWVSTLSRAVVPDASILVLSVEFPSDWEFDKKPIGKFKDKQIVFYESAIPNRFEALFGVPYLQKTGKYEVDVSWEADDHGRGSTQIPFEVKLSQYKSEKLRVDPSKVSPPKSAIPRILREQKEIGRIYRNVTAKKYWSSNFALPVKSRITSPFGTKRLYNGKMKGFHRGLDLKAPTGTPIRAPAPGKVVLSKDLYYTGNTVILDHGYGVITLYAHLSKIRVKNGQEVSPNQILGLAGATGRVNGPHLHWGAIIHRTKVNPLELTRFMQ